MGLGRTGLLGALAVGAVAACGSPPPEPPTSARPGVVEVAVDDLLVEVTVRLWVDRQPGGEAREPIRASLVLASAEGRMARIGIVSVTLRLRGTSWTATPALVGERSDVRSEYTVAAGPDWGAEAPVDVTVVLATAAGEQIVRIGAVAVGVVE